MYLLYVPTQKAEDVNFLSVSPDGGRPSLSLSLAQGYFPPHHISRNKESERQDCQISTVTKTNPKTILAKQ